MAQRAPFEIGGTRVPPGGRATVDIPVAHLYTHTRMGMPVHVIHGRKHGPHLFVSAAIHGDEIIGVEIIRRLLKLKKIEHLRGTLLAVPVVNVFGFIQQSRYLPDRRDLNRFFPGSEKGSLTSQLADIFMDEVVQRSTHGIDLHAGSNHRTNLPQIRASLDDSETRRLALSFCAPVVLDADPLDKTLRQAVTDLGRPMLLYEAGEALRFDPVAIRAGVRGILRVMGALGMLPPPAAGASRVTPLVAAGTTWVRAPASGIFHVRVPLGAVIAAGDPLGLIADPFASRETVVPSPAAGMVIGRLNLPLVHQGDAIVHLARFDGHPPIAPTLEEFARENRTTPSSAVTG